VAAGCWLLLGYAFSGNTISAPQIIGLSSAGSSTSTRIAIELAIFVAAGLPGYLLAIAWVDHGLSAGLGKLGAFAGVFAFLLLQASLGLRGTLLLTAGLAFLGLLVTRTLPEPARRSLDEVSGGEQLPDLAGVGALAGMALVGQPPVGDSPSSWLVLLGSSVARRPVPPDRAA
jgi:hypothetical protein